MEKFTVVIKLKPYLQEYLRGKMEDDINTSLKELVGSIVVPFIERPPLSYVPCFKRDERDFDVCLLNNVKGIDISSGKYYISEVNLQNIERIIDKHFSDLYLQYMNDKVRYTKKIKDVIYQFCSDYNITCDSINYEMLKKRYYRWSNKKKINKVVSRLSLVFFIEF